MVFDRVFMFKKISSFIIISYSFMAFNDSSEYICENEMFAKLGSELLNIGRFADEGNHACDSWSMNKVDNTISKYIADIYITSVRVASLRRCLFEKKQMIFTFNNDKQAIVDSISQEYTHANKTIADTRKIIQACKDFCIEIEKECYVKIYGCDKENYGGNPAVNVRNGNVMMFNNLYKSCFQTDSKNFLADAIGDEIKQLHELSFLVKDKLFRHMLWGADTYYSINSKIYDDFSCLRSELETFEKAYDDIKNFNRVLDTYEEFFKVIKTEIKNNNFVMPCDVYSSDNDMSSSESSEEENRENIKLGPDCGAHIDDDDLERMSNSFDMHDDFNYLSDFISPNSPTEHVKKLIKKSSKGKNKDNSFVRKPKNKKHYGYSEKNPENSIFSEVVLDQKNDKSIERKNSRKNIPAYVYDPEDMFHDSDDLYSAFRQF